MFLLLILNDIVSKEIHILRILCALLVLRLNYLCTGSLANTGQKLWQLTRDDHTDPYISIVYCGCMCIILEI